MKSESVIFGKWDNHGNSMNLRLSAQKSQKVDESAQLVFKHGNKQLRSVEESSDLKYIIKYTLIREVDEFTLATAVEAIELFNDYHNFEIDPYGALEGWELKENIPENEN
ncbi:MAG: hypothetical protein ACI8Z7_000252 [Candidatus Nanohaloarchaea archaeon]|jgi:hypothetical protein